MSDTKVRSNEIQQWLQQTLHGMPFELQALAGDASHRRYWRVRTSEHSCILMDTSAAEEDTGRFLQVGELLGAAGLTVPQRLADDLSQGLVLLSDFGDSLYLQLLQTIPASDPNGTAEHLYQDAINAIWQMQCHGDSTLLPDYDDALLQQEMHLFTDWLLAVHLQMGSKEHWRKQLAEIFTLLRQSATSQPQVFVHRDFHSRNLLYLSANNPGLLDYQDAVRGPATYDLVSLLRDCYIVWPQEKQQHWLQQYLQLVQASASHTDWYAIPPAQWQRWFDLMGVQRHLKASGIFARLHHRDGKSGFLADIPRTLEYILVLRQDYPEIEVLCQVIETILQQRTAFPKTTQSAVPTRSAEVSGEE